MALVDTKPLGAFILLEESTSSENGDPVDWPGGEGSYDVSATATDSAGNVGSDATLNELTIEVGVSGTVGYSTEFTNVTATPNRRAVPVIMTEDGTIESLSMYHEGGSGELLLAIYDDGTGLPDSLLAVTASTLVNSSPGWQTIDLIDPLYVEAGTTIWLAWVFEFNTVIRYDIQSPGRAHSSGLWADGMPGNFGSSSQAGYVYSIYANYTS